MSGLIGGGLPLVKGINDAAIVVGGMSEGGAFIWKKGDSEARALENPPGSNGSSAEAINKFGVVAGTVYDDARQQVFAGRWNANGELEILQSLAGSTFSEANGINDAGVIVGQDDSARATIWDARFGTRDLNTLVIRNRWLPRTINLRAANAISATGWIVVTADDTVTHAPHSYVLIPVSRYGAALCRRL